MTFLCVLFPQVKAQIVREGGTLLSFFIFNPPYIPPGTLTGNSQPRSLACVCAHVWAGVPCMHVRVTCPQALPHAFVARDSNTCSFPSLRACAMMRARSLQTGES